MDGDLRFNVDPFNQHSDEEILRSLTKVEVLQTLRKTVVDDKKAAKAQ